jgi:hypothetical protein
MKKSKTNKKFENVIREHKKFLQTASWCDIAETIIDLEITKHSLLEYLDDKQIKEYDTLIDLYEQHKMLKVENNHQKRSFQESLQTILNDPFEDTMVDLGDDGDEF